MRYAVLFPGQGSQFVGMGADLFAVRRDLLGEPARRELGWSLETVCLEGPEEELTRTDRAQPALYALAYALWLELQARLEAPPVGAAGHSLGEYTALAAAGMVDFATGLQLVAARGRAMAEAAEREPSGMAALLGVDDQQAESIAAGRREEGGRLWVANFNAPGQVVVAGSEADLSWLAEEARRLGVRRVVRLRVAGAFHSPYMASAAEQLRAALASVAFARPRFPVWSNATARPMAPAEAPRLLAEQLFRPVRFTEALRGLAGAGAEAFVHVGPGDATAGMARRTVPDAEVLVVDELGSIAETVARLVGS